MEKIADSKPTAELSSEIIKELSPEMIKTICDSISQEFCSWELGEENDANGSNGKITLDPYAKKTT